mmetsp:Transcript_6624/g.906  ORF Transcript_6624/g.906 Transcript_6624/m.906 type:complete len:128 (+) Transcript_6624:153-536(+)
MMCRYYMIEFNNNLLILCSKEDLKLDRNLIISGLIMLKKIVFSIKMKTYYLKIWNLNNKIRFSRNVPIKKYKDLPNRNVVITVTVIVMHYMEINNNNNLKKIKTLPNLAFLVKLKIYFLPLKVKKAI